MVNLSFLSKFNPLNYLFGRIFLGFWGAVVVLIWLALFVSYQLSQLEGLKPADPYHINQLNNVRKQLNRKQNISVLDNIKKIQAKHKRWIYILKKPNSRQLITPDSLPDDIPINKLMLLSIASSKQQIRLDKYILTGPTKTIDNGQEYEVFIAYRVKSRNEFYKLLWRMPDWLKLFLAAIVTILPCWIIARNISGPISQLRNSSHALAQGHYNHRIDVIAKRHDELGDLARDFNYMAAKIENQFELHKRLLGDVSHELRTPLTRLELSLALAIKNPQDCDKQLNRIETEIHKLDEMIGNVLRLARLENEDIPLDLTQINLADMISSIIQAAEVEAEQKHIQLHTKLPTGVMVNADIMLLTTAIENIIRNAIKYSPAYGKITTSLELKNNEIQINITDTGNGVCESEIDKIFTPFYRVAKARDRHSGGTGLGLAIAQKAVYRHKGKLTAHNIKPQGLSVNISLPHS